MPPRQMMGMGDKKVEKVISSQCRRVYNPLDDKSKHYGPAPKDGSSLPLPKPKPLPAQKADDHSTNTLYGHSAKKYPTDCPPVNVMWFHAIDVGFLWPLPVAHCH